MRTKTLTILAAFGAIGAMAQGPETKDIIVSQRYKSEAGSIGLVGVCRASETAITCWDGEGAPNPTLSSELTQIYEQGQLEIRMKYGKKNRIAVFDFDEKSSRDPKAKISFQKSLTSPDGGYATNYSTGNRTIENRMYLSMTVPKDQLETQATTQITERLDPSERLSLKLGDRIKVYGAEFRIAKIGERQPAPEAGVPGRAGSQWVMVLVSTGPSKAIPQGISWSLYGEDDLQIRAVNADGEPVLANPTNDFRDPRVPKENQVFQASLSNSTFTDAGGDEMYMTMNVNPARIKAVVARSIAYRNLIIKGIPLEPKGAQ